MSPLRFVVDTACYYSVMKEIPLQGAAHDLVTRDLLDLPVVSYLVFGSLCSCRQAARQMEERTNCLPDSEIRLRTEALLVQ